MPSKNISIIGNGVYGNALAYLFEKRHNTRVFGRSVKNPGEFLLSDFPSIGVDADYVIMSITTSALSEVYPIIAQHIKQGTHVILAMKGLTTNRLLPIDECRTYTPDVQISVLSGPGFAHEIQSDIPVHLILTSMNINEIEQEDFLIDGLTLDFSDDIVGVSWCGVLKNIYAIGAGILSAESTFDRSHYTTEVVHELTELLVELGGKAETAIGPAGRGDVWICTTPHSRNFRYGASHDITLRDQAEGYNAGKLFGEKYGHLLSLGRFPIISSIIEKL